ncbi:MAG: DUF5060 domain-containing protein [Thalassotalea sp.]
MQNDLFTKLLRLPLLLILFLPFLSFANVSVNQTGELKKWHKVSLTFNGPQAAENDKINPFINYRLNVEFTHSKSGKSYNIPGFFAADGDAANTSATSGNKWRVHFTPDEIGQWQWQASFRTGNFVAVSTMKHSGVSAKYMDNQIGSFIIDNNNKQAPDFRAKGRLQYINQPYLKFADSNEFFIKSGPDAPENLLSYVDFDGTFHQDGHKDELVKTWQDHYQDWQKGDPVWQKNKGKALIGALNYIADKGMNSISFLTLNIMGDDKNVFPYVDYDTYDRFDISKLAQWDIIFDHAQSLGLFLHFKTQEVENQGLLDNGGLGLHRQLYYRELIARYGHNLALNWNMCEESGEWHPNNVTMPQSTIQRLAMARYFHENDPYKHHIVIHNGVNFLDLLDDDSFYSGISLQTSREDYGQVHSETKRYRSLPVTNGRPFAVSVDEPGHHKFNLPPDSEDPEHNFARMNALWGSYMAGAWGVEWYFGYAHEHSDLSAQSWRTRELFWQQVKHALDFFKLIDVPYQNAVSDDSIVNNKAWALAQAGEFYIVYVKDASKEITLRMLPEIAKYSVQWYDPRNGGVLQPGSVREITLNSEMKMYWKKTDKQLGLPPKDSKKDWVILVKKQH